jgi:HAD superfamily hydrolase (TIGR01549 family)
VDEFEYAFVPSFASVHFGKPQPEYYAELLARTGKRPAEALMVGDDWKNDIVPATLAGSFESPVE